MKSKIVPISDLRREASRILSLLEADTEAVYITHYGRPVAVLVDYDDYERLHAQAQGRPQAEQPGAPKGEASIAYAQLAEGAHSVVGEERIQMDAYVLTEDGAIEQRALRLTRQAWAELRAIAEHRGLSQSEIIQEALDRYLRDATAARRLARMRGARGIWSDRDDLDAVDLRETFDREDNA